ncbi:tripartite tricarboxylate transporter TctB family protein [Stappia sp. BW2]|uniref:tripartite tricarboxylate transporter TctB family protein n=1 Tax=Stappia sp. BW2 TaxID=2592622 RepID=UPI0011DEF435|nr:tripartite tricarboxylate transporter TctB family protein [Stappia sp. BW2]TYC69058.1 tripartite tricarboxylate transporter TctB family protein [Stappia sp. BW2]
MIRILSFLAMFRRERRPGDLVFAVAFLVLAALAAAALPSQAKFLGNKEFVSEPGFWPLIGVGMMLLFGGFHLITTLNAPRLPGRLKEVLLWGRSLEYVAWFVVYVFAVPYLGYLPGTVAFAVALSARLGFRSWQELGLAAVFAVAVVLVFKTGLGVKLPGGAIYQYLPPSLRSTFMVNF